MTSRPPARPGCIDPERLVSSVFTTPTVPATCARVGLGLLVFLAVSGATSGLGWWWPVVISVPVGVFVAYRVDGRGLVCLFSFIRKNPPRPPTKLVQLVRSNDSLPHFNNRMHAVQPGDWICSAADYKDQVDRDEQRNKDRQLKYWPASQYGMKGQGRLGPIPPRDSAESESPPPVSILSLPPVPYRFVVASIPLPNGSSILFGFHDGQEMSYKTTDKVKLLRRAERSSSSPARIASTCRVAEHLEALVRIVVDHGGTLNIPTQFPLPPAGSKEAEWENFQAIKLAAKWGLLDVKRVIVGQWLCNLGKAVIGLPTPLNNAPLKVKVTPAGRL